MMLCLVLCPTTMPDACIQWDILCISVTLCLVLGLTLCLILCVHMHVWVRQHLRMEDWMLVASEEATWGSVMAKQDRILPCSSGSNHCSCCALLP